MAKIAAKENYNFKKIEQKWQKEWERKKVFASAEGKDKKTERSQCQI